MGWVFYFTGQRGKPGRLVEEPGASSTKAPPLNVGCYFCHGNHLFYLRYSSDFIYLFFIISSEIHLGERCYFLGNIMILLISGESTKVGLTLISQDASSLLVIEISLS